MCTDQGLKISDSIHTLQEGEVWVLSPLHSSHYNQQKKKHQIRH